MGGLRRLCKLYGRLKIQGVQWVWDYEKDEPRKASDLTKEQLRDIQFKREEWRMEELSQKKPREATNTIQMEDDNGDGD